MRAAWLGLVAGAACGRVGFDARLGDGGISGVDSGSTGDGPGVVRPSGLVFDLSFEGGLIDHASGTAVTCRTTCTTPIQGVHGNAHQFVSSNPDAIIAANLPAFDPTNGFTIALWVRYTTLPTTQYYCLFAKPIGAGSFDTWAICISNQGDALYHAGGNFGTDNLIGAPLSFGVWHHVAMTWDTATKRGYVDGVFDGSRAQAIEVDNLPLVIGADLNSDVVSYPLEGALDEVMLFNRALSDLEIQQLAQ